MTDKGEYKHSVSIRRLVKHTRGDPDWDGGEIEVIFTMRDDDLENIKLINACYESTRNSIFRTGDLMFEDAKCLMDIQFKKNSPSAKPIETRTNSSEDVRGITDKKKDPIVESGHVCNFPGCLVTVNQIKGSNKYYRFCYNHNRDIKETMKDMGCTEDQAIKTLKESRRDDV
jgi:hypothetical protein